MDQQFRVPKSQKDHFEEVASAVWTREQESRWIVAKLDPGDRVDDSVLDVVI